MLGELYKYLVLNDRVSIPGVGSFTVRRSPAKSDGTVFHPPVAELGFEPGTALTDKNFYHFLAREKNMSEVDAVRRFQDFAYQLRSDLQSHAYVELSGIGILRRNHLGEIGLEPVLSAGGYFPSIDVTEVTSGKEGVMISEEESATGEETTVTKDRWWIWATVLALLALAAIGYFYMQEQF